MSSPDPQPTRRTVLAGTLGGLSLPLLAACGSGSTSTPVAAPTRAPAGGGSSAGTTPGGAGGSAGAGAPLGPTSAVPVGGGTVFKDQQVVVTQPRAGEFKAFSAVCTHQGCLVDSVSGGEIHCPCHGSAFSAKDGSVVAGPAPAPLPAESIKVSGGTIRLT
ncbi:MAG: Rieske (2Fe-2S) protein [Marmoricola sp.]